MKYTPPSGPTCLYNGVMSQKICSRCHILIVRVYINQNVRQSTLSKEMVHAIKGTIIFLLKLIFLHIKFQRQNALCFIKVVNYWKKFIKQ